MSIGVLAHIDNPTFDGVGRLARSAEEAGARWLGLADTFWWHDGWLLLGHAAAVTERVELGLAVTNPYLRHPFHTISAVATMQALAGPRIFLGLAAGGTEVSDAAGVSRRDAATRITALVELLRAVAGGAPLDERSGRTLGPPLTQPPVLVAGRGDEVLRAAGAVADRVLLWAVPQSDLERTVGEVHAGTTATGRAALPELIWAPILDTDGSGRARRAVAYAALNSHRSVRQRWGFDGEQLSAIRAVAVRDGNEAASELVPPHVADDIVVDAKADGDQRAALVGRLRSLGITSVAVRGSAPEHVGRDVEWAGALAAELASAPAAARSPSGAGAR